MKDLTKGPVAVHVLQFAGFIALTTLFQTLYFLVDLYFVGRLGKEAIAGVGLAGNVMMVVLALTQALGVGATSLIARAMGANDRPRADRIFNQAFVLSSLVGVAFGIVAFALRGVYVHALAADEATAAQGTAYLSWFIPAMALQFAIVAMGAVLRGIGDMKMPTVISVLTVIVNIILAPVLTVGWLTGHAFGVRGAAIASLVAIVVGCAAFVVYFRRPSSPIRFRRADWRPDVALWKQMLAIGLPSGGEFALMAVYAMFVYHILQPFGAAAQAGFGIGVRVVQSLFLPAVAIGFATAPVVGQNFGAREGTRVRHAFYAAAAMSVSVMALMTGLCHIAPEALVGLFTADQRVIAFGGEYLRIISWVFMASGIIFAGSSTLQGLGNTKPALAASAMRLLLFALPAYVLSSQTSFEIRHLWYLSVASVFIHMAILVWLVHRQFNERLATAPLAAGVAAPRS
ncbi:MAG TPA: MATE family efflux transporter [Vicinamibacterales bacterium]|nr:MATE family efflux transporter [Vicinamibacterales bacterium]